MTKIQTYLLIVIGLASSASLHAAENWSITIEEDPVSKTNICLLVSKIYTINDGQTTTPVQLTYNGKKILAKTKSDIDLSYPNTGLQIDTHERHSISRIHKKNIVVFANIDNLIHQQFIDGRNARLSLGFWPTWPQTHTRVISFSLIGYTKAYARYKKCLTNDKQP